MMGRPYLAAFLLGPFGALAFAPFYFWPGLLVLGPLVELLRRVATPGRGFLVAAVFGFTYFLAGVYWVGIAFYADAATFGPWAVPAVLGLCFILGLTVGVAGLLTNLVAWRSRVARILAFAVAWTLTEILREYGPQFPWNPVSSIWAGSDAALQNVAWAGTYGLSLITVAAFAAPALLFQATALRRWALAVPAVLAALLVAAGWARLHLLAPVEASGVSVRIVQGNIAQGADYSAKLRRDWFERHLQLSRRPVERLPTLVVWPESAVPYQIEQEPLVRELLAEATPPGGHMLVGGDRFETGDTGPVISNSMFVLDAGGAILGRYDKVDLVPFGEFLPFRSVLGALGMGKLTQGSLDFSRGHGRATLSAPGLPPVSPLICYEAIFPGRATLDGARPQWLLNITNDAWFGDSTGPHQHLAQARMRAVEEGLPLVRAANTGISVVTDAFGRIVARLPQDEAAILDAPLPPALAEPSLARRHGGIVLTLLLAGGTLAAAYVERRARMTSAYIP